MKPKHITLARAAAVAAAAALALTAVSASAAPARTGHPEFAAGGPTLVGVLDPTHVLSSDTELVLYGAYSFDPSFVTFNQHAMPSSIQQLVEPYVLVPDGNAHTYDVTFHVNTTGTTTTQYQLTDQHGYSSTQTVADGANTVTFTITAHFSGAAWEPMVFKNISGDNWVFYSCEIDEQTG